MKNDYCITRNKKYEGRYIALKPFTLNKVVASGKDSKGVFERAKKKGIDNPCIIFIPKHPSEYFLNAV